MPAPSTSLVHNLGTVSDMASSLLSRCLRQGQGLLRASESLPAVQHQLHTSNNVQGSLSMPERLENIPQAAVRSSQVVSLQLILMSSQDPGFFEMVEYFFHKVNFLVQSLKFFLQ